MTVPIMNLSWNTKKVTSNFTLLQGNNQNKVVSSEYKSDAWKVDAEPRQASSLAFLPILSIFIFLTCSLLKVYKWSRNRARWKARGDVEFGDEAEVNYGIISAGDKDYCQIDIRSDGASVYDTVNSFKFFNNEFNPELYESHQNNDTVSSYQSLMKQKTDGSQYDSYHSYKAFLQKLSHNKDLAVEVKLLTNYNFNNKSAENCVLEKRSSERSEFTVGRSQSVKKKKCLHRENCFCRSEKRKSRRVSCDVPPVTRRRSLRPLTPGMVTSQAYDSPTGRYTFTLSGDSETQQSFRLNRRNTGSRRKKIAQSSPTGRMFTVSCGTVTPPQSVVSSNEAVMFENRKRHFSADSMPLQRKSAITRKKSHKFINNGANSDNCCKSEPFVNKIKSKTQSVVNEQVEESLSKKLYGSHYTSVEFMSDALVSGSGRNAKKNVSLFTVSDGRVLDKDVLVSFGPGKKCQSSSDTLQNSPKRPLSQTKLLISHAREQFFKNKLNKELSDLMDFYPSSKHVDNNHRTIGSTKAASVDRTPASSDFNNSTVGERTNVNIHCDRGPSQTENICSVCKCALDTSRSQEPDIVQSSILDRARNNDENINKDPHRVQRFHIINVGAQVSSKHSDQ